MDYISLINTVMKKNTLQILRNLYPDAKHIHVVSIGNKYHDSKFTSLKGRVIRFNGIPELGEAPGLHIIKYI